MNATAGVLSLNDSHSKVLHEYRQFTATEIAPFANDWDRAGRLPRDIVLAMGRAGYLGALIPAEYVTETSLLFRQQSVTAGRDINMFHIWVYQPK